MLIAAEIPLSPSGLNWFDAFVGITILYGLWRGIRTGLTGEVIRTTGWIILIVAALKWYQPFGGWIKGFLKMDGDLANLVSFIILGVLLYTCALAIRWFAERKRRKFKFGSILENSGGAVLGVARMVALTMFITVMLCLTRSPFWHDQIGKQSMYGRFVVRQLPEVNAVVQKNFPKHFFASKRSDGPKIAP